MKYIGIGIVLAFVVVGGALFFSKEFSSAPVHTQSPSTVATTAPVSTSTSPTSAATYTLADVATHNSPASCWTAINGKVYDVTSWISKHPGGPEHIEALCGTDGSSAFNTQHGGQARPASELATFYIGDLAIQ